MSKIFITSYPYVYERYFKVWDYFPEKEKLVFILPQRWEAKGGKIQAQAPQRADLKIIPVPAFFTHSHYPLFRGLWKGWMPKASGIIRAQAKSGDVLYTAIEPNLLTTYFNARLAKRLGLKHVFFTWQNVSYRKRLRGLKLKLTEAMLRATANNSVGAICGNSEAAEILKNYTSPDFKMLVAPISGVDTERFRPGVRADFRSRYHLEGKIVLTFVGVFDERKGIMLALEAFRRAVEQRGDLCLVMIGVGPLEERAKDFVRQCGLAEAVTFIPWLSNDELPGILANSDIFLHPSQPVGGWEEQFGYSMAEASACGLPVIATRSGSIKEIILDGQSGILVEPGQSDQLQEAILKLAADRYRWGTMGIIGRRHIEENFDHKAVAHNFHKFFEKL